MRPKRKALGLVLVLSRRRPPAAHVTHGARSPEPTEPGEPRSPQRCPPWCEPPHPWGKQRCQGFRGRVSSGSWTRLTAPSAPAGPGPRPPAPRRSPTICCRLDMVTGGAAGPGRAGAIRAPATRSASLGRPLSPCARPRRRLLLLRPGPHRGDAGNLRGGEAGPRREQRPGPARGLRGRGRRAGGASWRYGVRRPRRTSHRSRPRG